MVGPESLFGATGSIQGRPGPISWPLPLPTASHVRALSDMPRGGGEIPGAGGGSTLDLP